MLRHPHNRQKSLTQHHHFLRANRGVQAALVLVLCCSLAVAQHVGYYSKVLTEGEPAVAEINGSVLCLGAGSDMVVFDLDSLGVPRVESRIHLSSLIRDIALQGSRAFVLCASGALSVVDVSSVHNLRERFRLDVSGTVRSLAVAGDRIAIASDEILVVRYDSSASRLTLTDSYSACANRVAINNWYLCAATPDSGLIILGWQQGQLQRVGRVSDSAAADVSLVDTLAFVTYSDIPRLTVVGITRPDHPTILGTADLTTSPQDLTFDYQDSLICVIGPTLGIATVRITQSGQATVLGTNSMEGMHPRDVKIRAGMAYIPCGAEGLRIVLLADPTSPQRTSFNYDEANDPRRVAFGIDSCFVADGPRGLVRLSASDPRHPEFVDFLKPRQGGFTNSVSVEGGLARTAEGPAKLRVIGTRGPLQAWYESDSTGLRFNDLALNGQYAYIADGTSGLRILDAADTTHYVPIGNVAIPGAAPVDVCVSGGWAYLAAPNSGASIVDVTTPDSSTLVSTYPCIARAVAVSGSNLYVAADSAGLIALNVAAPQNPLRLSDYVTLAPAVDICVNGHYAYVACGTAGLQILDVSQPSSPHLAGSFDTDGFARFVSVTGDVACVSDSVFESSGGGLYFLDVSFFTHVNPTCLILASIPNGTDTHAFMVSINPVANLVYRTLAAPTTYGPGRVIYVSPQRWQDLDGDGRDDGIVDQDHLTLDSVRAEFMRLSADSDFTMDPVIYLVGSGSPDYFQLAPGVLLSADTLAAWVNHIPVNPQSKLVIVIESCQSGSFINDLSDTNRIIITSTNENQPALFEDTRLFSTYFWSEISKPGQSIALAFQNAGVRFSNQDQTPQLSADGNHIANQPSDFIAAADAYLLQGHLETLPGIIDPPQRGAGNHVEYLQTAACTLNCVTDSSVIAQRVWYRIFPSDYAGEPPALSLPAGDMYMTGQPGAFQAVFTDRQGFFSYGQQYFPEIYAIDQSNRLLMPLVMQVCPLGSAAGKDKAVAAQFTLSDNYPNPFNSVTQFRLNTSAAGHVTFTVFNILGQKVAVLLDGSVPPGEHIITWDGTSAGVPAASGVFIARLESSKRVKSVKMVLLR